MLTDVVKAGIARLGHNGEKFSGADVEAELERQIQEVLQAGGEQAERLLKEIAQVLRQTGAVGAALEAAVKTGDRELQAQLAAGLAELGDEFDEFGFVLVDLGAQLRSIRESVDRHGAELQFSLELQYRQATDTRLLLEQVTAIERRIHSGRTLGVNAEVPRWEGCPYRGLVAFSEADAEVFYGREPATAQLVTALSRRLTDPGLLVVTGASGAGKSSLLRAGLMPAIGRGELSEPARHWTRHVLERPTRFPLSNLATLLAAMAGLDAPAVLERLSAQPHQAHLLARQAAEADARRRGLPEAAVAASRLVLVIDQFEEIFTLREDGEQGKAGEERAAFVTALHSAGTIPCGPDEAPAALVVIAVRGDFIDRCADYPQLATALARPFVLGPMSESDLRRAIIGPADAAGLDIQPGLVNAILAELRARDGGYGAGALPLLSQAMLMTWEHREGDRLTSHGYGRAGGVTHAVANSAETAYGDLDPTGQATARQVFHQLTVVSHEGGLARRATTRSALYAAHGGHDRPAVAQLLEAFAQRRLVVVDEESVQIAHDVLLVAWPRLRGWLESDLAGYALYSQLIQDAEEWERNGRKASYLYRGERLDNLLRTSPRWQAEPGRYPGLSGIPQEFLDAAKRAETRVTRRRRTLLTALATVMVVVLVVAVVAVRALMDADRQRDAAVSRRLAAQSELIATDPALSALLAVTSWQISPTDEARASMLTALSNPAHAILAGHTTLVSSVAFSPDGRTLATSSYDEMMRLWDVAAHKEIAAIRTGHTHTYSMMFSPDGRTLATGGGDGTVRLWNVTTRQPIGAPLTSGHSGAINSMAFSPDGRILASGATRGNDGTDGVVRLWDVATRQPIGAPLTGHNGTVSSVAFSPDGRTLTSGGNDDTARLWNVTTRKQIGAIHIGYSPSSVAFSPDGRTLAIGGNHGMVLWDLATRKGTILTGFTGAVYSVAFSPDGRTLASGGDDGTARLWDMTTRKQIGAPLTGYTGPVSSVAFSPDGRTLATSSYDRTVRLWNVANRRPIGAPLTADGPVAFSPDGRTLATSSGKTVRLRDVTTRRPIGAPLTADGPVAFSPDGRILITGIIDRDDGAVRLWNVVTRQPIGSPLTTGHTGPVTSVAFSPDGRILAIGAIGRYGGNDGAVRLWNVMTRQPIGSPLTTGHTGSVTSVAFSPDGRVLAIGTTGRDGGPIDGAVRLWDVATRKQIGAPLTGHIDRVNSV
ncbi:AAA family ATPase, partial [Microbispora bryophytorum]|uniref:nSTAND1 domain-containing NTPase n=1 Tax=Microbispora bryophytorum TaxID=1460882 RepID=UPI00370FEBD7